MFKLRQKLFLTLFALLSIGLITPTLLTNRYIDREVREEIAYTWLSHGNAFSLFLSNNNKLSMIQAASYYSDATGLRITLINKDG